MHARPTVQGILTAEAQLRNNQSTPEEDILSQLKPIGAKVLHPGMDYKDGQLWYTFPGTRTVMKKKGKGKDAPEVPVQEVHTVCVNGERDLFLYEENNLHARGYRMPDSFMVTKGGWKSDKPYDYAKGGIKEPDSYELYMRVRKVYETYIEFAEEEMYDIITSWVMATYVYQVFDQFAYLHFNGTAASGKSQNLRILAAIGFNAQWTTNLTAAGLFRGIANNPGIFCIDEAESFRDEKGQELRTILRNGYKKGMDVKRLHGKSDGTFEEHSFNTYGPKALASINALDDTTSQRAIVMGMRPAYRDIPYFDQDHSDWSALRDDLYIWGLYNAPHIHTEWMRWNTRERNLINRAWEVSACVVVTGHYVMGDTVSSSVVGYLERYFERVRQQQDANDLIRTLASALPSVLNTIPARDDWWYPLSDIRDKLLDITDEDVSDKITTRSIQRWLKPLGLETVRKNKGGKQIQLVEDNIRTIIRERRIEPLAEDVAWLAGKTDYQTEDKRTDIVSTITWGTDIEEDDDA